MRHNFIKKLFYTLLISLALTGNYTAMAQTVTKSANEEILTSGPEYEKHYKKLKELYIKELKSESYKKSRELTRAFYEKINYKGNIEDIRDNILPWIKENIKKTSFESYKAAEKEWEEVNTASMESVVENNEYYAYMQECLECCGPGIITKARNDVREENPELIYGKKTL